jgi:hypothetical protein
MIFLVVVGASLAGIAAGFLLLVVAFIEAGWWSLLLGPACAFVLWHCTIGAWRRYNRGLEKDLAEARAATREHFEAEYLAHFGRPAPASLFDDPGT